MSAIQDLFDQDIHRRIEKVIQYQTTDEELLRQEVGEYVATDSVQDNLERILDAMDDAMSAATERDVGVWVSGFYGSGKSSFTKYMGYALDSGFMIGGVLFRDIFKQRLSRQPLQQRLETVARRHNPVVIMVDLSVDFIADQPSMPISTVLFLHVLRWAGYSSETKIALLELFAEEQGKLDELKAESRKLGREWDHIHNSPIVAAQIGSQIAVRMFPELFKTEQAFMDLQIMESIRGTEQVQRMLDLIKRKSGRDKVVFIIDEAGQYAAHSEALVLNLQGFAQNLKAVGKGRAWILATAQQTLTDDVGALNSPKLFKLKDRFALPVELQANDIKVITHTRLLSKKTEAKDELARLFAEHGPRLTVLTRLENVKGYSSSVEQRSFIELYPFLPQHFDLMMNIIARLAKSTGGTGLRSAIKVVQETLIAGKSSEILVRQPIGTLVTVVKFYDILRADLENSPQIRHTVASVQKTIARYGEDSRETEVAKAVAVLQILDDFPLTRKNLAALLVSRLDASDESEAVNAAVDTLLKDEAVPLEEVDGRLRFLSEQAAGLAAAWRSHQPTSAEQRQVLAEVIKESLLPYPPAATIVGKKTVKAGVNLDFGGYPCTLHEAGEGISVSLRLVEKESFKPARSEALNGSTAPAAEKLIVSVSAVPERLASDVRDAYASARMLRDLRGRVLDADEKEFFTSLNDRLRNAKARIEDSLRLAFEDGAVIFRGQERAVKTSANDFPGALSSALEYVSLLVFDKFEHAAVTVPAQAAEKIIKTKDHGSITSLEDPLSLLSGGAGGTFNAGHPAVTDIQDFLNSKGSSDGKTLLDELSKAPYGWNKDVSRYIVAAMFTGGLVSLRIDSRPVTAVSPSVVEAFKSNVSFAKVGIDAPPKPPEPEVLLRARNLLTELTGHTITPLPKNIEEEARSVLDIYMDYAGEVSGVANRLNLGIRDAAESLSADLRNLVSVNQDLIIRAFGDKDNSLGSRMIQLRKHYALLTGSFAVTLREARDILSTYERLPETGSLGDAKAETAEARRTLETLLMDPDLDTRQTQIQEYLRSISEAINKGIDKDWEATAERIARETKKIRSSTDWKDLAAESREKAGEMLDSLDARLEIAGPVSELAPERRFNALLKSRFEAEETLNSARGFVEKEAEENRKNKPGKVLYLAVPSRELEVKEAQATVASMIQTLKDAPQDSMVRFTTEG